MSSTVYPTAIVCEGVELGEGCMIGTHVYIGKYSVIGAGTRIQHGAFLPNRTQVGERCFIGPLAVMTDDKWPRVNNYRYRAEPPILEDDCNIGAGAVLLPGIRIGHHATVGAGAVVTSDVAPHAVVIGCPARERECV